MLVGRRILKSTLSRASKLNQTGIRPCKGYHLPRVNNTHLICLRSYTSFEDAELENLSEQEVNEQLQAHGVNVSEDAPTLEEEIAKFNEEDPFDYVLSPDDFEDDSEVKIGDVFKDYHTSVGNPLPDDIKNTPISKVHTSFETEDELHLRLVQDDDTRRGTVHENIKGNMSSRLNYLKKEDRYSWSELRERIMKNAPREPGIPPTKFVTFIPKRQSDEIVDIPTPILDDPIRLPEYDDVRDSTWPYSMLPQRKPIPPNKTGVAVGHSGRKSCQASARIRLGSGKITINGRDWMYYFPNPAIRNWVLEPLIFTETLNKWDIECRIKGGGFSGQAQALKVAIARAILHFDPGYMGPLRLSGLLKRDPRVKERYKVGRAKARRGFQWVKR